jgi:outer membrane protein assembly factor BamB
MATAAPSPSKPVPLGDPPSYPTNTFLKWYLTRGYQGFMPMCLSPDNSTLYEWEGPICAINLAAAATNSGASAADVSFWTAQGVWGYLSFAIGPDSTLYGLGLANPPHYQFAAISNNGTAIWTFTDPQQWSIPWGASAVAYDGTVYLPNGTNVYALTNGGIKWFFACPIRNAQPTFEYSAPVIGADGTVYVNSDFGAVYALNPTNGAAKWVTTVPADALGSGVNPSPAIGPDGTVYAVFGNYFFAVNPANGSYRWKLKDPIGPFIWSPVVGGDGTVYVEEDRWTNTVLLALNPSNGVCKWTNIVCHSLPNDWFHNPILKQGSLAIAADGEIYDAGEDGVLYSFAPTGTLNWLYNTGGGGLNLPLIGPDGTIYVQDYQAGNIYAFAGASPVACCGWPENRRNARRTGAAVVRSSSGHLNAPIRTNAPMRTNFQFTVTAPTNTLEAICATMDFATWTNLGQIYLTNGSANFIDTKATNYQRRFYRAVPQ